MKAFIIFRDRKSYGQQCLLALLKAGLDVVVIDCGTTWPEARDWLDDLVQDGIPVLERGGGGHPRDLWGWEPFREACGTGRYIVTDPDVVPSDDCPLDWPDRLGEALDQTGRPKAGLGLRLDRIPDFYPRREKVLSWEGQFWERPLGDGLFDAVVDTTLALYQPLDRSRTLSLNAVRTGPPYLADHLAWYEDHDDLPPDLEYYHEHADRGISYWTVAGKSVWGD